MILKTGPDRLVRPVQMGTGHESGPIMTNNRKELKTENSQKLPDSTKKPKTGLVEPVLQNC